MNDLYSIQPFRFWCQKVLPLVYDDSLSYYELLCKVTDKLNEVINNQNILTDTVIDLTSKFNQLKDYVNNYFMNLDVQEEINNKLDEMVKDGTLNELLQSKIAKETVTTHRIGSIWGEGGGTSQGFCVYNGIAYLVSQGATASTTVLMKFNARSGNKINNATLPIGHCNSLTFDSTNNYILANDSLNYYTIDPDNLTITGSYETTGIDLAGSFYDKDLNQTFGYAVRNNQNFVRVTLESDMVYGQEVQGPSIGYNIAIQNGIKIGNLWYFYVDDTVFVVDHSSMKCIRTLKIDRFMDGIFNLGEVEQWSIDSGIIYGSGALYMGSYQSQQYGGWLTTIYEVGLFGGIGWSPLLTPRSRLENYIPIYCCDNTNNYNSTGAASNPIPLTEGLNTNPNLGISLILITPITNCVVFNDRFIEGNGQHIGNLIVQNATLSIGSVTIDTSIMAYRANITLRNTVFTVPSLNCNSCTINARATTFNSITAKYSLIYGLRGVLTDLENSRFYGNIDQQSLAEAIARCLIILITTRGQYLIHGHSVKVLPYNLNVGYDTYLNTTDFNNITEINSTGQAVNANIQEIICI